MTGEMKLNIYFTASSPPRGEPTPEIDPYERHAHSWREPKAKRLGYKEKEKICDVGSGSTGVAEVRVVAHSRARLLSSGLVWQGEGVK